MHNMMHKMIVSAIIAAFLGGYVAMLYAFVRVIVLINDSYLLSLAMLAATRMPGRRDYLQPESYAATKRGDGKW